MAIIEVKNLTKKFENFTAVNNISFSIEEGEIFAFLGPNGAGKSTTIKMLTTVLSPSSGSLVLDGYNIISNQKDARHSFGIVFQDASLDDELTAYENMETHGILYHMNKKDRRERIKQLLDFVELWDRKDVFVKKFSGGMKRRLEIARGLLHSPKVLFLDEPTLGLDPQTRNHMWEYLRKLNQTEKITIFFTTHYMEEVEHIANRVAVIDHGSIITSGTIDQLKKSTDTQSLEEAFLKLTGKDIRKDEANKIDAMRSHRKVWKNTTDVKSV